MTLIIRVVVEDDTGPIADYVMNHDDPQQRRVLGQQCRLAFEAGQSVWTCPEDYVEPEPSPTQRLIALASSRLPG
jgi:hypothetical protein